MLAFFAEFGRGKVSPLISCPCCCTLLLIAMYYSKLWRVLRAELKIWQIIRILWTQAFDWKKITLCCFKSKGYTGRRGEHYLLKSQFTHHSIDPFSLSRPLRLQPHLKNDNVMQVCVHDPWMFTCWRELFVNGMSNFWHLVLTISPDQNVFYKLVSWSMKVDISSLLTKYAVHEIYCSNGMYLLTVSSNCLCSSYTVWTMSHRRRHHASVVMRQMCGNSQPCLLLGLL